MKGSTKQARTKNIEKFRHTSSATTRSCSFETTLSFPQQWQNYRKSDPGTHADQLPNLWHCTWRTIWHPCQFKLVSKLMTMVKTLKQKELKYYEGTYGR